VQEDPILAKARIDRVDPRATKLDIEVRFPILAPSVDERVDPVEHMFLNDRLEPKVIKPAIDNVKPIRKEPKMLQLLPSLANALRD
jgi:hypothetical protein